MKSKTSQKPKTQQEKRREHSKLLKEMRQDLAKRLFNLVNRTKAEKIKCNFFGVCSAVCKICPYCDEEFDGSLTNGGAHHESCMYDKVMELAYLLQEEEDDDCYDINVISTREYKITPKKAIIFKR